MTPGPWPELPGTSPEKFFLNTRAEKNFVGREILNELDQGPGRPRARIFKLQRAPLTYVF